MQLPAQGEDLDEAWEAWQAQVALRPPLQPAACQFRNLYILHLPQGEDLLKHGRHGKPKMHYFRLVDGDARLSWRSAKGAIRTVPLQNVVHLKPGQQTDTFKKHLMPAVRLAFPGSS